MGRFPSGQREQTVNLPLSASVVRIHPCPPSSAGMAELADAHDSGSCVRTYLQVQVLFPARVKGPLKSELFDWTVWISGGLHLWKNKGFRETGCHRYRWTVF